MTENKHGDNFREPEGIGKMDEQDAKDCEKKGGEPLRTYPRVDERHAAYKILVENGIDKRQAALILGYKPKSAYEIEKRLEKKGKRIEVTTDRMVRKAVKGLKNCIDGKPWGDIKEIKDSTALAAINTVLDRSHPKQSDSDERPSLSFVTINLGVMAQGLTDPALAGLSTPVDVTPRLDEDKETGDET